MAEEPERLERVTITLPSSGVKRLREMAKEHHFITTTGLMSGQGNISGLLQAIADGRLVILDRAKADELERAEQALPDIQKRLTRLESSLAKYTEFAALVDDVVAKQRSAEAGQQ